MRPLLSKYIDNVEARTKYLIPNFLSEINAKELKRVNYQPENNMSKVQSVTEEQLDKLIEASTKEFAIFDATLTIAVVKLPCGFKVVGQSACVDPKNFNKELGEDFALQHVKSKLWELEGYRLSNDIHNAKIRSYQGGN